MAGQLNEVMLLWSGLAPFFGEAPHFVAGRPWS